MENLKTKKIVLIHGEGFGAWCWYKTIALLEESKLLPVALDLTGSGIDLTDINSITTLLDYSKPLIEYLQNLPEDEKVSNQFYRNLFVLFSYWITLHRRCMRNLYTFNLNKINSKNDKWVVVVRKLFKLM